MFPAWPQYYYRENLCIPYNENCHFADCSYCEFLQLVTLLGGQLDEAAQLMNILRSMKTHTESRWYSLILQALSVSNYQ